MFSLIKQFCSSFIYGRMNNAAPQTYMRVEKYDLTIESISQYISDKSVARIVRVSVEPLNSTAKFCPNSTIKRELSILYRFQLTDGQQLKKSSCRNIYAY